MPSTVSRAVAQAVTSQPFTAEFVVTDDFNSAVNGTKVRTRPGFSVFPPGETTVSDHFVINAGVAEWVGGSDWTPPGTVIIGADAGVKSVGVTCTIASLPDNPMSVYLASQSVTQGLRIQMMPGGSGVNLQKVISGTAIDMNSLNTTFVVGDVLEVEIIFDSDDLYPLSFTLKKNGVQTAAVGRYEADWTNVPFGTICGIGSWCMTGKLTAFAITKRVPTPGTLFSAGFESCQAVAMGDSTKLSIHLVALTPNVVNRVHLNLVRSAGLQGKTGDREFFVRASSDGTGMIELTYKGLAVGEQSVTVSTSFTSFTSKLHVMRFLGMTLTSSAVQEDKVTAVLSFDGLPPGLSQIIPLSVVQPAGLAEMDWDEVLVRADASGAGTGWVGGFASAAGTPNLSITACTSTFSASCTVTALPSIASMPKISDAAAWGGSIPAPGADAVLPVGYMVWDSNTPAWGSLTIPAGSTLIDDPAVNNLTLTAGSLTIDGGRILIGRAAAKRSLSATISLTGVTPTRTARTPLPGQTVHGFIVTSPSRSLINDNGDLIMHGAELAVPYTKITATVAAGTNTLSTEVPHGWANGDPLLVTPTAYYTLSNPETFTMASGSGSTVQLSSNLAYRRWGQLQYATDTGLSLTPGRFSTKRATKHVDSVVDQRAYVANLKRPLRIEAPNDASWTTDGHGVTTIAFGRTSAYWMTGVEIERCGQRGVIEHYPYHAHFGSYEQTSGDFSVSTGLWIGDVPHMTIRGCVVKSSKHRATTIHASTGVRVMNNVIFDVLGHAIMFEEGSEERLQVRNNLVCKVGAPTVGDSILTSDQDDSFTKIGAAGLWITNFQSDISSNVVIGALTGIWNAPGRRQLEPVVGSITKPGSVTATGFEFARKTETWTLTALSPTTLSVVGSVSGAKANATMNTTYDNGVLRFQLGGTISTGQTVTIPIVKGYMAGCVGLSSQVDIFPFWQPTLRHRNNTAMFCKYMGMNSSPVPFNDAGDIITDNLDPQNDGRPVVNQYTLTRKLPFHLEGPKLHGNGAGNYSNAVSKPAYRRFVVSDTQGLDFQGVTFPAVFGESRHALFVGRSLRMDAAEIAIQDDLPRQAIASYHFTMFFMDSTVLSYPQNPTANGIITPARGLLGWGRFLDDSDLYTDSISILSNSYSNLKFYDVPPHQRTPPAHIETTYAGSAGGQDINYGGNMIRRWTFSGMLYDPYNTFGQGTVPEWLTYDHPFYDTDLVVRRVVAGKTIATTDRHCGIQVYASDLGVDLYNYKHATFFDRLNAGTGATVATWDLKNSTDAFANAILTGFHHASLKTGVHYKAYNPDSLAGNTTIWAARLQDANYTAMTFILNIPWEGTVPPRVDIGHSTPTNGRASAGDVASGQAKTLTSVGSKAAMVAAPYTWWHDTAADQLWVHFKGGIVRTNRIADPNAELFLGVTPA